MPRRWFRFRQTVARGLAGLSAMGRDSVSPTRSCRFVREENGYAKAPPKAATAPSPTRDDFRGARSVSALRATADSSRDPLAPSGSRGMPHNGPQVKPAGRLDVAQQCLVARQRVAVLRSGNPAARPADIRKRLPEKRKSSRVADDGEVSPSLIIINGVHAKAARQQRGAIVLTMLARSILMSALLLSAARAQPPAPWPPEADQQPPAYAPALIPVPANGCAWAGRSFSDGAGFCITDRFMEICSAGKWVREPATEGCHGALADTK